MGHCEFGEKVVGLWSLSSVLVAFATVCDVWGRGLAGRVAFPQRQYQVGSSRDAHIPSSCHVHRRCT